MSEGGRSPLVGRRTVSQWVTLAAVALALVTAASAALGVYAIVRLSDARRVVVDRNGPALVASLGLTNALLDEETGVRGFILTGDERSLAPYRRGRADAAAAFADLAQRTRSGGLRVLSGDLAAVRERVQAWQRTYAEPTIANVREHGPVARQPSSTGGARAIERRAVGIQQPKVTSGRVLFNRVRTSLATLDRHMGAVRLAGRADLANAASFLSGAFIAIVVLSALGILAVVIGLRLFVDRPLARVGRIVRRTARGAFHEELVGKGPRDVVDLTADVDSMRRRIVDELSELQGAHVQLDAQARELQRSNAELEQFAYVASHDLQEPLRKVASFCQLIEQRYDEQLDERGRQYIAFAVDGAKRMQQLINDLLAFSRVGHGAGGEQRPLVDCDEILRQALTSLESAIEEVGAEVVVDSPLPQVHAEPALLAAVFQNLVGNALKFRGESAPRVEIGARRNGDDTWVFSCADDGIGIEPDYAERIFMIFQRLHSKEDYAGTGIGLALCRKIVEYHGGRIWLDTDATGHRTTFRFTLPAIEETPVP